MSRHLSLITCHASLTESQRVVVKNIMNLYINRDVSPKDRYEKKTYLGSNDVSRHLSPITCHTCNLPRRWLLWACFGLRWLLWAFVGPSFVVNRDGCGWRVMPQCCGDELMGVGAELEK